MNSSDPWKPPIKEARGGIVIVENSFRETLSKFLKSTQHLMQVVTDKKHSYLTVIKVCQAVLITKHSVNSHLISKDNSTLYINWNKLSSLSYVNDTIKKNHSLKLIVINCTPTDLQTYDKAALSKLCETVHLNALKTVLITERFIDLHSLHKSFPKLNTHRINDLGFSFHELSEDTQSHLINKNLVIFQEDKKKISLSSLAKETSVVEATKQIKRIIDTETMIKLIINEEIKIGKKIQYTQTMSDIYTKRFLRVSVLDEKNDVRYNYISEEELINNNDNFIFITASEGMGKSTLLNNIFKNIKIKNQSVWLCQVNLNNNHEKFYSNFGDEKENGKNNEYDCVVNYLTNFALTNSDGKTSGELFEKNLLKLGLKGFINLVVVVEGFSDLYFREKEQIIKLLLLIQKTKVGKLLVTIRQKEKRHFKSNTKWLYYEIIPYSKEDQMKFLMEFWLRKFPTKTIERIFKMRRIVKIASVSIERIVANTPLKLLMVAELLEETVTNIFNLITEEVDLRCIEDLLIQINIRKEISGVDSENLLKHYIALKLTTYQIKKRYDAKGYKKINYKCNYFINVVRNAHQHLGLINTFGLQALKLLTEEELWIIEYLKNVLPEVGFVYKTDDVYSFVHKSFREYFVTELANSDTQKIRSLAKSIGWETILESFPNYWKNILESLLGIQFCNDKMRKCRECDGFVMSYSQMSKIIEKIKSGTEVKLGVIIESENPHFNCWLCSRHLETEIITHHAIKEVTKFYIIT